MAEARVCWHCGAEIIDTLGNGQWRILPSTHVAPHDEAAYPVRLVAVCIPCSETCARCGLRAPFGVDPHKQAGGLCIPH